jgi:hypothetical protein
MGGLHIGGVRDTAPASVLSGSMDNVFLLYHCQSRAYEIGIAVKLAGEGGRLVAGCVDSAAGKGTISDASKL